MWLLIFWGWTGHPILLFSTNMLLNRETEDFTAMPLKGWQKCLKMLNVEHRVTQLMVNHAFNIYHNNAPSYMHENFVQCKDQHDYSTRHSIVFLILWCLKQMLTSSINYKRGMVSAMFAAWYIVYRKKDTMLLALYLKTGCLQKCPISFPLLILCSHNTFFYSAIRDWNNLPSGIKEVSKKEIFKYLVKSHLSANMV